MSVRKKSRSDAGLTDQQALRAQLDRIRYLSDLANRANVNAGFLPGMPNPINARCVNPKCRFHWCGRDAIRSPSLANVRCFWCQSELEPLTILRGEQIALPLAATSPTSGGEG